MYALIVFLICQLNLLYLHLFDSTNFQTHRFVKTASSIIIIKEFSHKSSQIKLYIVRCHCCYFKMLPQALHCYAMLGMSTELSRILETKEDQMEPTATC